MLGVFKLETEMISGNGKFERTGIGSNSRAKESVDNAYKYLKAKSSNISGNISTTTKDYLIHKYDLRDRVPEHEKMGKGVTLSKQELKKLRDILNDMDL